MWTNIVLSVVFFVCLASTVAGGLWNNTLMLVNIIFSAVLAIHYFEPLAGWLSGQWKEYTHYWDFAALWIIFAVSMIVLRTATDQISKVKVRFRRPVEIIGGILFSSLIAWTMVGFTTITLHTAPLAQNFLRGTFQETPQSRMFFGRAPDRSLLAFLQYLSRGPYTKSKTNQFDPKKEFIVKYGWRRAENEKRK